MRQACAPVNLTLLYVVPPLTYSRALGDVCFAPQCSPEPTLLRLWVRVSCFPIWLLVDNSSCLSCFKSTGSHSRLPARSLVSPSRTVIWRSDHRYPATRSGIISTPKYSFYRRGPSLRSPAASRRPPAAILTLLLPPSSRLLRPIATLRSTVQH